MTNNQAAQNFQNLLTDVEIYLQPISTEILHQIIRSCHKIGVMLTETTL